MTTRILLIDEDREITRLLGKSLDKYGFEVIASHSSSQSVQLVRWHDPDAVLLDLKILELDGWQVCHEIRMVSQVPLIIFSDFSEANTITRVLEAGPDYFLFKSIPVNELTAYIKNTVSLTEQY